MQRQLRLGDILDDYCPRERRVTNHAVVAMVGPDVKQTRCSTCDTEHEYKHAKVPRQRRKADTPAALYSQVVADAPKRPTSHEHSATQPSNDDVSEMPATTSDEPLSAPVVAPVAEQSAASNGNGPHEDAPESDDDDDAREDVDEGPVHRPLIQGIAPATGRAGAAAAARDRFHDPSTWRRPPESLPPASPARRSDVPGQSVQREHGRWLAARRWRRWHAASWRQSPADVEPPRRRRPQALEVNSSTSCLICPANTA